MKLTYRLAGALLGVVLLVLTAQAWWRLSHDLSAFEEDMRRDHRAMGRALGNAISEVWASRGSSEALDLLSRANEREAELTIEWAWLDALGDASGRFPGGDPPDDAATRRAWYRADRDGTGKLHTYVPVEVPGGRGGVIHLSESLEAEHGFVRATVVRTVVTTAVLAVVAGLTAGVLGAWFVGRPIRALITKTRRIGAGDLEGPILLDGGDEFATLGREMNAMSDRLAETRRRLEEETRSRLDAVEQLRRADRLMTVGRMAAAIAHELGTPLNVISLRAQMLVDGEVDPPEVPTQARSIGEHAEQMARIIQQLLHFARPQQAERQTVDVQAVVRQTVALLEPMAARQQARLTLDAWIEPLVAAVDPGQIQQVLTNLVVNGLQAMTTPGAVRLCVRPSVRVPPGRPGSEPVAFVSIEVADEGTGIRRDDLGRIFEPFYSTKSTGAGLGLSVIEGIVRDHGGYIDVATAAGYGCTFTVHLPVSDDLPVSAEPMESVHAG
jgi:two-component system NtrC family sensor kinase